MVSRTTTDRVQKTPSKRVQQVLGEQYKKAEKRYGEPPGLEHSVKKAKQRPLEMSDLFQQVDEVDNTVEKEYFPDNLFGKSPVKKVTTLRRKVNRELQTEESKYASHLKEELNILDKFRHDTTNDAMERKVRINDIVEELEIAKEQLSAPEREHHDALVPITAGVEHENDDAMRSSMELLMQARNNQSHPFDDEDDEEEDLMLRPLPRHCVTESFQRVPTPKKVKKRRHRKAKQKSDTHRPLLLRSTLVKVLEDVSDLLEADFMMLKASETRLSFEDFEDIVSNHVPLDHTSLRELFEISNVDDDGTYSNPLTQSINRISFYMKFKKKIQKQAP